MKTSVNRAVVMVLASGAAAGTTWARQVVFNNGSWQASATTQSGVAAPSGAVWSEVANDAGQTTTANTVVGFPVSGQARIADDFVVPPGLGWGIYYVQVPVIEPGAVAPTVTGATLRIWNGPPNAGGAVVFGDTVTNRYSGAGFTNTYRCANTIVPAACGGPTTAPNLNLHVQVAVIAVYTNLPPGTYWVDYSISGVAGALATTATGTRQPGGAASNALRFDGVSWSSLVDPGQGCSPTPVTQEAAFWITGTPAPTSCYSNCDHSTLAPCLNVVDFSCFLNKFAAGDSYANCDSSTTPPTLNVNDFLCFSNRYSAGCAGSCMAPP